MRSTSPVLAALVLAGCASTYPIPEKLDRIEKDGSYEDRWRAAQLCGDLADEGSREKGSRQFFARRGIDHARRAIELKKDGVEGHYYHALCIGRLLSAQTLPTFSLVKVLEDEAIAATKVDPRFECSGAHRMLACLYRDAPEWGPCPVKGDPDKSEKHFQEALRHAPLCPENHAEYGTLLEKLGSDAEAAKERRKARELIPGHHELSPEQKERLDRELRESLKDEKPPEKK